MAVIGSNQMMIAYFAYTERKARMWIVKLKIGDKEHVIGSHELEVEAEKFKDGYIAAIHLTNQENNSCTHTNQREKLNTNL